MTSTVVVCAQLENIPNYSSCRKCINGRYIIYNVWALQENGKCEYSYSGILGLLGRL